jgi:hypothetical protein
MRRFPFSGVMSFALLAVAIWSSTTHRALGQPATEQLGFAGAHLAAGEWHRLVTSVFLTHGGGVFWRSWIASSAFTALAERRWGSWRTAGLFWGGHLWAVLFVTLGVAAPLYQAGSREGMLLFTASDVGPSAGYWTCIGAIVAVLPVNRRWPIGVLIALALAAMLTVGWRTLATAPDQVVADAAHLVAFLSGFGVAAAAGVTRRRRPPADG